jgi:hypothetical protein
VNVDSIAVGLVILPFAFVDISVSMPEFSAPIGFVFSPLSFVFCVIRPYLDTRPMSHFIEQVSFVDCPVFKSKFLNKLKSLSDSFLLKIDKVLVFGFKQLRDLAGLVYILSSSDIVLRNRAVSVVVY